MESGWNVLSKQKRGRSCQPFLKMTPENVSNNRSTQTSSIPCWELPCGDETSETQRVGSILRGVRGSGQVSNVIMSVLYVLIFLCFSVVAAKEERRAIAVLYGAARGNVTFTESGDKVRMIGVIEGLSPGSHGFHIHEKGDISMGCASTLGHYNPYNKQHGAPQDENRHVGDLGNILADERGIATFVINDHLVHLSGPTSVIGRAVVVHSDPDDLGKGGHPDSLTTGHAGSRVACGVIGTL